MSSIALGAAFAAVQLVYQAYSKVRTNRARCARLVERCQLLVDRLERIAATRGDAAIQERIRVLETAFERTAQTIVQVGQQSTIASLLQSEANALQIESCNEALTELISLFNLEETVDVRVWQNDLELARVHDHQELLNLGQRLETGNTAIASELAQQGATITEVLRTLHDINVGLDGACILKGPLTVDVPPAFSEAVSPPSSSTPSPSCSAPLSADLTVTSTPCTSPESTPSVKLKPTLRRLSFTKIVRMAPLSTVFAKLSTPSSKRATEDPPASSHPSAPRLKSAPGAVTSDASVTLCSPLDPPPPYQLRVTNPEPDPDSPESTTRACSVSSSRFTTASVEAVRAPDSPVPGLSSPQPSTECVSGSMQSLASMSTCASVPQLVTASPLSAAAGGSALRHRGTIAAARRNTVSQSIAAAPHRHLSGARFL